MIGGTIVKASIAVKRRVTDGGARDLSR